MTMYRFDFDQKPGSIANYKNRVNKAEHKEREKYRHKGKRGYNREQGREKLEQVERNISVPS
jgi:cell division septum initiation protein DivIVA